MIRYLFVGGPKHGEFVGVPGSPSVVRVPIIPPIRYRPGATPWDDDVRFHTATYAREMIRDRVVYVCECR